MMMPPMWNRLCWSFIIASILAVGIDASAQTAVPLEGSARDAARAAIISPGVFDPLLIAPLQPDPQVVIDASGRDVTATFHAALRNGDDSYGILVSAPLWSENAAISPADPRGLEPHPMLGFDLTNVIWRPYRRGPDAVVIVPWVLFFHASYEFNRSEYVHLDPLTNAAHSEQRLNDAASVLLGTQFLASERDPGYFVGVAYIYSAVFHEAAPVGNVTLEGPSKVRGNLLRVELRRQLPWAHLGVNPSYSYDVVSKNRIIDAAVYVTFPSTDPAARTHWYAGVRAGGRTGTGSFASVFAGPVFGGRPQ
jgi:hypothetical protein